MSSQNEDWLNNYSGIPYISDEMLIEMNLLANLDTQISGMTTYFYQNPFWSDSTDPHRDTACRAAARHLAFHGAMYNLETQSASKPKGISVVKSFGKMMWAAHPFGQLSNAMKAVRYEKSEANFHAQQSWLGPNLIQSISLHRYEKWLSTLFSEDRDLFFQVQNWHQQQEIIRLQQDQLNASQRQLQLTQRANQIAKEQLDSSHRQAEASSRQLSSIQRQTDAADRESHNDLMRIENAINKIRRDLD